MSEDLTKKTTPQTDSDRLKLILTIVQRIDGLEKMLENQGKILNEIKDGLGKLTARVAVMETRFDAVERRLDVLETRLNVVVSRLDGIGARLDGFEKTIKRSVHYLGRGQTVLNDAILKIHIGFLDIEERIQGLNPQHQSPINSQT